MMISRRELITALLLATPAALLAPQSNSEFLERVVVQSLADLEQKYGGRLGVSILDTGSTMRINYYGFDLFPMCSTFKFLAAAFVLARVDRKEESLARRVVYTKNDLIPNSPITGVHVGGGSLPMREICKAALTISDNTAANLMLRSFGGPSGLTAFVRSLGDSTTRLDRCEPDLNEAIPSDPRDTTSPTGMLDLLHKIVLGTVLSPVSRKQLIAWMVACETGDTGLRAGAPKGWRVGDKTGSGANGTTNDIAILWPSDRAPILVTAYYTGSHAPDDARDAVLAQIGRLASAV